MGERESCEVELVSGLVEEVCFVLSSGEGVGCLLGEGVWLFFSCLQMEGVGYAEFVQYEVSFLYIACVSLYDAYEEGSVRDGIGVGVGEGALESELGA